jgi:hypothetical protein
MKLSVVALNVCGTTLTRPDGATCWDDLRTVIPQFLSIGRHKANIAKSLCLLNAVERIGDVQLVPTEVCKESPDSVSVEIMLFRSTDISKTSMESIGEFLLRLESSKMKFCTIALYDGFMGNGIGRAFLAHCVRIGRAARLKEITLSTGMSIGPYAWAKYGFDFKDEHERSIVINSFNAFVNDGCLSVTLPYFEHAWEVADCAIGKKFRVDGKTMPIGKTFLLRSTPVYDMCFDLSPGSLSVRRFNAYSRVVAKNATTQLLQKMQ